MDERWMREALVLAKQAAERGEAPIGCVIVKDGKIIGGGGNLREGARDALAHAEILAIAEACATLGGWRLPGCELYVTLEPCPMCAGAIINARIDSVYFGAYDPKAGSCGSVTDLFALPYNHRPRCQGGILEAECGEILTKFFKNLRKSQKNTDT